MSGLKLASLMATVKVIIVMVMCCCGTIHAQEDCGYERYQNHALYGQNLAQQSGVDVQSCGELCDRTVGCQSFEHSPDRAMCYLNWEKASNVPWLYGKHRHLDYYQKICFPYLVSDSESAGVSLNGVSSFIQFTMTPEYVHQIESIGYVEILRLEFRTETASDSVLFSLLYGDDQQEITLRLTNQEMELVTKHGKHRRRRDFHPRQPVTDGKWHFIELHASYDGVQYKLDREGYAHGLLLHARLNFTSMFSGNHQIYFGASPAAAQSDVESAGEAEGGLWSHVTSMFRGCIRDVYMFDQPVSFNNTQPSVLTMVDMAGARTGCHIF